MEALPHRVVVDEHGPGGKFMKLVQPKFTDKTFFESITNAQILVSSASQSKDFVHHWSIVSGWEPSERVYLRLFTFLNDWRPRCHLVLKNDR
jgi:hypothetical protein